MDPIPYDPATCVTAALLRSKGCPVTSDIPDHAWIPKDAVRLHSDQVNSEDGTPVYGLAVEFLAPFTWDDQPGGGAAS